MVTTRSIIVFSVIIVAVILFAVGLVTAVYFTVYKRHINKTLMYGGGGEEQQKIRRMPSVGSATRAVFACAAIFFAVFMVYEMISLGKRLDDMVSSLNARINGMQSSIQDIHDYTDEKIKDANSIVTSSDIRAGEYDMSTHTVEVIFTVAPKATSGDAELSVTFGDQTTELHSIGGGMYEGTAKANIFQLYGDEVILSISDASGTRTEPLSLSIDEITADFLPTVSAKAELADDVSNALIMPYVFRPMRDTGVKLVSLTLITEVNGKKVGKKDLTYLLSGKNDKTDSSGISVDIPKGADDVFVYLTATDSEGYTYSALALGYDVDGDALYASSDWMEIRDKNGNVLRSDE